MGPKLLAAAASLAAVLLTGRIAERLGRPAGPAMLLVGLNPVLLVHAVGGGHNDLLMVALLLAGIAWLLAGAVVRGAGTIVAAVAVKASGGLILPVLFAVRRGERGRLLAGAVAASVVLTAITVAAFGTNLSGFGVALLGQQRLVAAHSVPNELGRLLGLGGAPLALRLAADVAFVASIVVLLWRALRGADLLACSGWALLALLICTAWLLPWYLVWLLPFAALGGDRRLEGATLLFTAYLLLGRLPGFPG